METTVKLGNDSIIQRLKVENHDGSISENLVEHPDLGSQVTSLVFPDGYKLGEILKDVEGVWPQMSDQPPSWVESSDEQLANLIAATFTTDDHTCVAGQPSSWEATPLGDPVPETEVAPVVADEDEGDK